MKAQGESYLIERFRAMNTDVEAILDAAGSGSAGEAEGWFAFAEQTFSRFREDSELSQLNRSAGRPFFVSRTMMEVLQLAEQFRSMTEGVFEPFILPALERAGYDVSFEQLNGIHRTSRDRMHQSKPALPGWTLDPRMGVVRLLADARLDLGGIVKGWAVDRMAGLLISRGVSAGLINAGGDLSAWGGTSDSPWVVEVAEPGHSEGTLAVIKLASGAAATSSVLGRRWRMADGEGHHLIDPRTMRPAESDTAQCTVVGPSAAACDIYAKTLCILGTEQGLDWWRRVSPAYQALLVTHTGSTYYFGRPQQWKEHWSGLTPDQMTT